MFKAMIGQATIFGLGYVLLYIVRTHIYKTLDAQYNYLSVVLRNIIII